MDDWGGPLVTSYAIRHPENIQSIVLMETFLWPMTWEEDFAPEFRLPFKLMRSPLGFVMVQVMNMMVKKLIPQHCPISSEALRHYIEAFPTVGSRRAMRAFPKLLPVERNPKESYEFFKEIQQGLHRLKFPVVWIKASPGIVPTDEFPVTLKRLEALKREIPHLVFKDFGPGHHFLAEENPERLSQLLVEWIRESKLTGPDWKLESDETIPRKGCAHRGGMGEWTAPVPAHPEPIPRMVQNPWADRKTVIS